MSIPHPRSRRQSQAGQSLVFVLLLLLALTAGVLVVFNTGQVVNKKVELVNAADAAAYSVAAEYARAWNGAAYMNRGRIANEVAIAQAVSLNSWMTQINVTSSNISKVVRFIPYAGQVIAAAMEAANSGLQAVRAGLRTGSVAYIGVLDVANTAYAATARAMIETSGINVTDLASRVVADNSPGAGMRPLATGVLAGQAVSARSTYLDTLNVPRGRGRRSEGGERYRNLVMESRDKFSRNRRDSWFVVQARGGTDLVDYDRWAAVDTFDVNILFGAVKIPVGWGGAQAVGGSQQPRFFPGINNGNGWQSEYDGRRHAAYGGVNRRSPAGRLVEGDPGGRLVRGRKQDAYFSTYTNGLAHTFHDIKPRYAKRPTSDREGGPIFTVEAQSAGSNARTSAVQQDMAAGRLEMQDDFGGDHIRALASAQVYFNRPHQNRRFTRYLWNREDRKLEMGSLFSPYWQARLVETPMVERTTLGTLQ
ncbi:MAG: pilus assembly protein TadG-related protein [Pseudoxanthomonas suwonensis]|nr:pilus assembly protein TadG-related protein [Pseudoxanthomonas suwonensis]